MANEQYGHPRFYELTREEEDLHSRKNHDYAAGGDPLGNFKREVAILSLYPNFPSNTAYGMVLLHMLKQLDAAFWMLSQRIEPQAEGVPGRLMDISIYAKLARIAYEEAHKGPIND